MKLAVLAVALLAGLSLVLGTLFIDTLTSETPNPAPQPPLPSSTALSPEPAKEYPRTPSFTTTTSPGGVPVPSGFVGPTVPPQIKGPTGPPPNY